MNHLALRGIALLAFGSLTALAHAESKMSEEHMMDACVQKYIADNLAEYHGKVTVNKMAGGIQPLVLGSHKQIEVSATHRTSGQHLGTVICDVRRDGSISVAAPKSADAAKLAKLLNSPVIARNQSE